MGLLPKDLADSPRSVRIGARLDEPGPVPVGRLGKLLLDLGLGFVHLVQHRPLPVGPAPWHRRAPRRAGPPGLPPVPALPPPRPVGCGGRPGPAWPVARWLP